MPERFGAAIRLLRGAAFVAEVAPRRFDALVLDGARELFELRDAVRDLLVFFIIAVPGPEADDPDPSTFAR